MESRANLFIHAYQSLDELAERNYQKRLLEQDTGIEYMRLVLDEKEVQEQIEMSLDRTMADYRKPTKKEAIKKILNL